jgi:hypothetical protein
MKKALMATSLVIGLFALGSALAGENLKSGPQVGEKVPGPFEPLNLTGDKAGEKACLFCKNGSHPVAMIFARDISEPLTGLIKKIDAATAQNEAKKMGSFVVFLNDDDSAAARIKDLAQKSSIEHTVLSLDKAQGPEAYKVSKDADVTVVLYTNREVKANYAFAKGELGDKDIDVIVGDLVKILPNQ